MQDAEGRNLEAHVAACGERYKTIFHRLGRLEKILIGANGAVLAVLGTIAWSLFKILEKIP